jgi:hypothetical protein
MIGDGVVVDFGKTAFLGADGAGEVAEMVDGKRHVSRGGLADRLAIVPGLGEREQIEVFLHAVGDAVQDQRAFGDAGAAPGFLGRMRGVERVLDVLGIGARDLAKQPAVDRREILEIAARARLGPFSVDVVPVSPFERGLRSS